MSDERSVTSMIRKLRGGDSVAAHELWDRFFVRMHGLARVKLDAIPKRSYDEEDLVLSAFNALCIGAREGRFRQLESRDDLWQIIVLITSRRASNVRRAQGRRPEYGESQLGDPALGNAIDYIVNATPDDAFTSELELTCREKLQALEPNLAEVALLRFEGYGTNEIAEKIGKSRHTVQRYMEMIRRLWTREA